MNTIKIKTRWLTFLSFFILTSILIYSCSKEEENIVQEKENQEISTNSVNLNSTNITNLDPVIDHSGASRGSSKKVKFVVRHGNRPGTSCVCPGCKCPNCPCPLGICFCSASGFIDFLDGDLTQEEIGDDYGSGLAELASGNEELKIVFDQHTAEDGNVIIIEDEDAYISSTLASEFGVTSVEVQEGEYSVDFSTYTYGVVFLDVITVE